MKAIKKLVIDTLLADSTLRGYVARRIYPRDFDIMPDTMPMITIADVAGGIRTVPRNCRDMVMQLDIWSNKNQTEVENIYERVTTLLNYLNGLNSGVITWWIREDSQIDISESDDRRIWHKAITYRAWAK